MERQRSAFVAVLQACTEEGVDENGLRQFADLL